MTQILRRLERAEQNYDQVQTILHDALYIVEHCGTAYGTVPERIRRLFNQVLFERILVNPDETITAEKVALFATPLGPEARVAARAYNLRATALKRKRPAPKSGSHAVNSSAFTLRIF